jgi:hypothetical protein
MDVPKTRYKVQAREPGPARTTISTAIQPISSAPTPTAACGAILSPQSVAAAASIGPTPIKVKRTIPGTRKEWNGP